MHRFQAKRWAKRQQQRQACPQARGQNNIHNQHLTHSTRGKETCRNPSEKHFNTTSKTQKKAYHDGFAGGGIASKNTTRMTGQPWLTNHVKAFSSGNFIRQPGHETAIAGWNLQTRPPGSCEFTMEEMFFFCGNWFSLCLTGFPVLMGRFRYKL